MSAGTDTLGKARNSQIGDRAITNLGSYLRKSIPGSALLLTLLAVLFVSAGAASAETRTLRLMNVHTKEKAEITFKRNGSYVSSGVKKVSWLLRDWRRNEPTKMDPRLLDLVWEAYRATGSRQYIHIVSGYRSPATNSMLRRTRGGQAKKSQHMLGKAMDFYIPGVSLSKVRNIGLKLQAGGVGYYPRSGSPFVHLDVGGVRHWPRMSRSQLMAVFPDGRSMHVPSDGRPLPRYKEAVAAYNSRKKSGSSVFALAADDTGGKKKTLLAALFGGGADEEEETSSEFESKPSAAAAAKAKTQIESEEPVAAEKEPENKPEEKPEADTLIAALSPNKVPVPAFAQRPKQPAFPETAETTPLPPADVPAAMPGTPMVPGSDAPVPPAMVPGPAPANEELPVANAEQAVEVALVPRPSRRPKYAPAATVLPETDMTVLAALQEQDERAAANAANDAEAKALLAALEAGTQDTGAAVAAEADVAAAEEAEAGEPQVVAGLPVPSTRPGETADADSAVAAYAPEDNEIAAEPVAVALAPATKASPRKAILESGGDTGAATQAAVRTTPKAARPSPADASAEPKARVVAVEPDIRRWALHGKTVTNGKTARVESQARKEIRTAPTSVIALGFDRNPAPDPRRFSGNAVTFMSVAKFEKTN